MLVHHWPDQALGKWTFIKFEGVFLSVEREGGYMALAAAAAQSVRCSAPSVTRLPWPLGANDRVSVSNPFEDAHYDSVYGAGYPPGYANSKQAVSLPAPVPHGRRPLAVFNPCAACWACHLTFAAAPGPPCQPRLHSLCRSSNPVVYLFGLEQMHDISLLRCYDN